MTAAHTLRESKKAETNFETINIIEFIYQDDVKIGQISYDSTVLKYSGMEDGGEDLALLRITKRGFSTNSTQFYLENKSPELLISLFHMGNFDGEDGYRSISKGILSRKNAKFE